MTAAPAPTPAAPISIMEEKARRFKKEKQTPSFSPRTPQTPEETEKELRNLHQILKSLSGELAEAREVLEKKEKQFLLLANYKHSLELTQITPTIISLRKQKPKEKDDIDKLLEKLEALTPEQKEKLRAIEL